MEFDGPEHAVLCHSWRVVFESKGVGAAIPGRRPRPAWGQHIALVGVSVSGRAATPNLSVQGECELPGGGKCACASGLAGLADHTAVCWIHIDPARGAYT